MRIDFGQRCSVAAAGSSPPARIPARLFAPSGAPTTLAAMHDRVIVTREPAEHWNAAFEDAPGATTSGKRPGNALLGLVKAHPERAIDLNTVVAAHSEITVDRIVFAVSSHEFIQTRNELRAAFRRFGR